MQCPSCEKFFSYQIVSEIDGAEEGEPFECPMCETPIRLVVDEGSYCGARETWLEIED